MLKTILIVGTIGGFVVSLFIVTLFFLFSPSEYKTPVQLSLNGCWFGKTTYEAFSPLCIYEFNPYKYTFTYVSPGTNEDTVYVESGKYTTKEKNNCTIIFLTALKKSDDVNSVRFDSLYWEKSNLNYMTIDDSTFYFYKLN